MTLLECCCGFCYHLLPRNISVQGIGAALYPASRHCGMTNAARGFTLIEFLVVVFIIGILAAVALPQYQNAVWKSRVLEKRIYAKKLVDAIKLYDLNEGEYISGQSAKNFFDMLDINFPEQALKQMNVAISQKQNTEAGKRTYPGYAQWYIKYPDFAVCVFLTPNYGKKKDNIVCASQTPFGDKVCQGVCGVAPTSSLACGSASKGCLLP